MSTLCPHCGAHHGFGAAQLEGHGTMKSDPNIQRIADLERQLAEAKAEVEAMRPFTSLILSGPDGETLVISSDIEPQTDGSFRFTVTSPISGRRFGVVCGITELRKQP